MKTCLACQGELRGRIDKKYCDQNCRNAYHNDRYRNQNKHLHLVNKNLSKNHRILEELALNEVNEISLPVLKAMGFQLSYFTSMVNDEQEGLLFFIYDMCYQQFGNEIVIKVREIDNYRNSA